MKKDATDKEINFIVSQVHTRRKNFSFSADEKKWIDTGECGGNFSLPDGTAAECDPDGNKPCCNDTWNGQCGNTTEHCSCIGCIDYKFEKDYLKSGGKLRWRYDGRCGTLFILPDHYTVAQCDPDGENPCCSDQRDGRCGNTTDHCTCADCKDYKLLKDWEESDGAQRWRYDGKCGNEFLLPDYTPGQCYPDGKKPCCSDKLLGECGNTTEHCSCEYCTDYRVIYKDWRESGGTKRWRYDGRCGNYNLLPDGSGAQCDPDGDTPCCNDTWDGKCGNTTQHCSCKLCIDYKVIHEDWKEFGTNWRYDGRCGRMNLLPDGVPAQCDPDGVSPCCSDPENGRCGNKTEHCSCVECTNYKFVKEWEESGGSLKWRYDKKCGVKNPLPDGSWAQSDPNGENPCCDDIRGHGNCGNRTDQCVC